LRYVSAIVLLAALSTSLIPQGVWADSDAQLPACCRRDGTHHCSMMDLTAGQEPSSEPALKGPPKCPRFPGATAAPVPVKAALPLPARTLAAAAGDLSAYQGHARRQIHSWSNRSNPKRGPPSLFS
jgi:hypothetical protein